jgi:hypothetical protein
MKIVSVTQFPTPYCSCVCGENIISSIALMRRFLFVFGGNSLTAGVVFAKRLVEIVRLRALYLSGDWWRWFDCGRCICYAVGENRLITIAVFVMILNEVE